MARVLPYDVEAERAVLGGVLIAPRALERVIPLLRPEDFHDPRHEECYRAFLDLRAAQRPIDPVTVLDQLKAASPATLGPSELAELAGATPTAENITFHAALVRDKAALRRLVEVGMAIVTDARSGAVRVPELVQEAIDRVAACLPVAPHRRIIRQVVDKIEGEVQSRAAEDGELRPKGVPTGLADLDRLLTFGGLPRGQVTVVGGDSSKGKSALALGVMSHCARAGLKVLDCTLEDGAEARCTRMLSGISGIGNRQLQRRVVGPAEQAAFQEAVAELRQSSVEYLEDMPRRVEELCARVRYTVERRGIDLVVWDYLQLVPSGITANNEQQHVDHCLRAIVALARSLTNTATLLVSQFGRRDTAVRPALRNLYHSGAIEQWAHTVLLIWAPELDEELPARAVDLAKQKDGPTGMVVLGWTASTASFHDAPPNLTRAFKDAVARLESPARRRPR